MHAVKSASSAAQLKNITVDVTAEPGDVLIKTAFLRQKNMPFYAGTTAVDYTLSVPRTARIARAASGVSALPMGSTIRSRSVDEDIHTFYEIGLK